MRWRARTVAWIAVALAVLLQGALIARLHVPLAITPVVVVVVAMRMTRMEAILVGFFAGILLDLAPPASGLLGAQALILMFVAYFAAAQQSLVPRVWWLRGLFAGALSTVACAVVLALQVLSGQPIALGLDAMAALGWQFALGSLLAVVLWPAAIAMMGPPPRRRMGVAP